MRAQVEQARARGLTVEQTAHTLRVPVRRVREIWEDMDTINRGDDVVSQGQRPARNRGLDHVLVERIMRGQWTPDNPRRHPPERLEAVRRLAAKGIDDGEIGRRLRVTAKGIWWLRKRHGIAGTSAALAQVRRGVA